MLLSEPCNGILLGHIPPQVETFSGSSLWIATGSLAAIFLSVSKEGTGLNAIVLGKKEKNPTFPPQKLRNNAAVLFLNILLTED